MMSDSTVVPLRQPDAVDDPAWFETGSYQLGMRMTHLCLPSAVAG